ncbi:MAG: hypothetical protein ISR41_01415 [Puniceicoccaceae bacterium]|nr:hypothetical protein [Puniceicoccaceae bacterium]
MTKITLLSALTTLLILPSVASAATTADFAPGPGETATAGTWTRVLTVITQAAGNAEGKAAQTVEINVTPPGDFASMEYRVLKQNKDQSSYQYGNATQLFFGPNTITVGAVTDADFLADPDLGRTVKIQFRTDNIAFNSLTINGLNANPDEVEGSPGLGQSLSTSEHFDAGPDATWQAVLPLTTVADGAASRGEQTAVINVTYIPQGGASYQVYKTDANNGDDFESPTALVIGENSISVAAETFDRTVKVQFSNDVVEFDALTVNGEDMLAEPPSEAEGTQGVGDPISDFSNIITENYNATWFVATMTTPEDGAASQIEQTAVINVTYIPEGGATWRSNSTNAGGNYNAANEGSLALGPNTITVSAVAFDRTVKIQFSSDAIEFDALTFNGVNPLVTTPGVPAEGTPGQENSQSISESTDIFVATNSGAQASGWVTVTTMTTTGGGAASQSAQTLEMNVTYIPEGGAEMRTYNSNESRSGATFSTPAQALTLGPNTITVPADVWANPDQGRATKVQFSSVAIEFDALTFNDVDQLAPTPAEGTQGNGDPLSQYANIIVPANATVQAEGWVSIATMTTPDDGAASQGEQTAVINVTYIPEGGATWRSNSTNANDVYNSANEGPLSLGSNTITVPAAAHDRTVKIQFSSNAIEFTALTFNGVNPLAIDDSGPKVTIANSNLFNSLSDETWVTALTTAVRQDGASSHSQQSVELYITSLPTGGAMYRVYRTINADADPDFETTGDLYLGLNTINVSALGSTVFDRAVKIQFNSEAIEFNALSINGVARVIGANVTEVPSLSIDNTTLSWTVTDGTTLQLSYDLESWTSLPTATSPYTPTMNNINSDGFYRMISDEGDDGGEDVVN